MSLKIRIRRLQLNDYIKAEVIKMMKSPELNLNQRKNLFFKIDDVLEECILCIFWYRGQYPRKVKKHNTICLHGERNLN